MISNNVVGLAQVADFDCPSCDCKGTVIAINDEGELGRQQKLFTHEYNRRMADWESKVVKVRPRKTKYPQQQYACSCSRMITMHGDILSSTCKDCIANGDAIPDCPTCKCQCFNGVFLFKDVQAMAVKKLQLEESKACACIPDVNERAHLNLGMLLATAVHDGISRLQDSNSAINESNVLFAAAGHLPRLQLPSEEELHVFQQHVPLTARLCATGEDVRQALNADPRKKGKRHSQNCLR
jgi:hypothetical protein